MSSQASHVLRLSQFAESQVDASAFRVELSLDNAPPDAFRAAGDEDAFQGCGHELS